MNSGISHPGGLGVPESWKHGVQRSPGDQVGQASQGKDEATEAQGENQTCPRQPKVSDRVGPESTCSPGLTPTRSAKSLGTGSVVSSGTQTRREGTGQWRRTGRCRPCSLKAQVGC